MRKLALLSLLTLTLAGCQTVEVQDVNYDRLDDQQCRELGAVRGTRGYTQCRMDLEQSRSGPGYSRPVYASPVVVEPVFVPQRPQVVYGGPGYYPPQVYRPGPPPGSFGPRPYPPRPQVYGQPQPRGPFGPRPVPPQQTGSGVPAGQPPAVVLRPQPQPQPSVMRPPAATPQPQPVPQQPVIASQPRPPGPPPGGAMGPGPRPGIGSAVPICGTVPPGVPCRPR